MDILTGVGVLDKSVGVLHTVGEAAPATLADVQALSGLPRATAYRLLAALEQHGLVRRDDAGRYRLGLALISLGQRATEQFPLADRAYPVLTELRDETGESVQLFVREPAGRRCVASLQSPHGLRWIVPEGALLPNEVGSAGRVLNGDIGPGGWTESVEEREPGVASVSAPIHDGRHTIVAAVSVSGPVERLSRKPGTRFGADVVAAAAHVQAAAG